MGVSVWGSAAAAPAPPRREHAPGAAAQRGGAAAGRRKEQGEETLLRRNRSARFPCPPLPGSGTVPAAQPEPGDARAPARHPPSCWGPAVWCWSLPEPSASPLLRVLRKSPLFNKVKITHLLH